MYELPVINETFEECKTHSLMFSFFLQKKQTYQVTQYVDIMESYIDYVLMF